jgi:hypothetical protein
LQGGKDLFTLKYIQFSLFRRKKRLITLSFHEVIDFSLTQTFLMLIIKQDIKKRKQNLISKGYEKQWVEYSWI